MANRNRLLVPQSRQILDMLKYEIAEEFGVTLGADTKARENGSVGGEMVKRMVQLAEQDLYRL